VVFSRPAVKMIGFGEDIPVLLVLTSDLEWFVSAQERNQAWIDGGMFAMSLVLALHSFGLGTCCLNWCATPEQDEKLHSALAIPESHVVTMMIAVEHLPEVFRVTRSNRKKLHELLVADW